MNTHHNLPATSLVMIGRNLGMTVVSGRLSSPMNGRMWIGNRDLDDILCPSQTEQDIILLIAPGGTSTTYIHTDTHLLEAEGVRRLEQARTMFGGNIYQGHLAVLTPKLWHERYTSSRMTSDVNNGPTWPHHCGNNAALFLDSHSFFSLLAQANAGTTVTLLAGITPQAI